MSHIPVLLEEAGALLRPKEGETVLDVTIGLAGHARMFLERIGRSGALIGLDADAENLEEAEGTLRSHGLRSVHLIHANFRDLPTLSLPPCDILFADLGLSSPHIDRPERGFSFRADAPLDSRFDRTKGRTAADLLRDASAEDLLRIFTEYGEVPRAQALVEALLERRSQQPIVRTGALALLVHERYGHRAPSLLPQVFQALRIAVNDEWGALHALLDAGPFLLKPSGRMAVLSYHSLEDRLVKNRFRELSEPERHPVTGAAVRPASFQLLTKRPIRAENQEVERNPRARSARLRGILRLSETAR